MAYVGVCDIRFVCRGESILRDRAARKGRAIYYRDYMRQLSRKPQAVRQVAPELVAELGQPYSRLWTLLERTHGPQKACHVLAGVLGAIDEHGEEIVTGALCEALADGRTDLLAIRQRLPVEPLLFEELVPPGLQQVQVEAGCAADFDYLLAGGVR
jgi:hypothetical protein